MTAPSILIASEHPQVRDALLSALDAHELHGVPTEATAQILEKLREDSYPVIVIEDHFGGGDTIELFEQFKQVRHEIAGVLVCERGDLQFVERAFEAGIRRVLSLPIVAEELTSAVEAITGSAKERSKFEHEMPEAQQGFIDDRGMQRRVQDQECQLCGQMTPWRDSRTGYYFCSRDCQTQYWEANPR